MQNSQMECTRGARVACIEYRMYRMPPLLQRDWRKSQENMRVKKAVAASASIPRSPGRHAIVVAASAAARYSTGDCMMLFMTCELTPFRLS